MRSSRLVRLAAAALVLGCARPAAAQIYEAVGTRAQGMGGAFVAVADDATASWWNPAGIATGNLLSLVVERGATYDPAGAPGGGPERRDGAAGLAVSYPALALSYYRLRVSEIAPLSTTAAEVGGRQDQEPSAVALRTLALSQFGVTVGQSLGDHFVVASTLKLVRAGRGGGVGVAGEDGWSQASDLDVASSSRGDVDLGAMAAYGAVRLGVAVKHLTAPGFGEGDDRFELERQARGGLAVVLAERGRIDAITAAVDFDLTRTPTVAGDVRHVAFGLETWMVQRRVGLRTGLSVDTAGRSRTTGSVGGSVGGFYGMHLNGAVLFGSEAARNGWSTSLSMTF